MSRIFGVAKNALRNGAIRLIRIYQKYMSPLLGSRCRFAPTCSQYAIEAIERFGLIKGGFYSILRIFRCNPFCKGGYDPIPDVGETLRVRRRKNIEFNEKMENE